MNVSLTPKIEVRIMHVPGTRPAPWDLSEAFAPFSPRIMCDPMRKGPWWNLKQCLRNVESDTTHVLVLNDDVTPTPGVIDSVRAVAAHGRETFVSLYSYHPMLEQARRDGYHWIETFISTWGCAQLIPTSLIVPFLEWNARHVREDWNVDDTRWALFAIARGKPNYVFAPSLVDHRGDWASIHMPGKTHQQTAWLAQGPILAAGKRVLKAQEQDGPTYLKQRAHRFARMPELPKENKR